MKRFLLLSIDFKLFYKLQLSMAGVILSLHVSFCQRVVFVYLTGGVNDRLESFVKFIN